MIVRTLDVDGDWTFGKGKNDYKSGKPAIAQSIRTRLYSFLGDCFFAVNVGIDWFNLLGSKNITGLNISISTTILNTNGVTGSLQLSSSLDAERNLTGTYNVDTVYGVLVNQDLPDGIIGDFLITESGSILTTESGGFLEP